MRCIVQRVSEAAVTVEGHETGRIGRGLLVLAAFASGDGDDQMRWMANKLVNLRLFNDEDGRINLSLRDVDGGTTQSIGEEPMRRVVVIKA